MSKTTGGVRYCVDCGRYYCKYCDKCYCWLMGFEDPQPDKTEDSYFELERKQAVRGKE